MVKTKRMKQKDPPQKPGKCIKCIWGRWEGTAQFCSRPVCQKGKTS